MSSNISIPSPDVEALLAEYKLIVIISNAEIVELMKSMEFDKIEAAGSKLHNITTTYKQKILKCNSSEVSVFKTITSYILETKGHGFMNEDLKEIEKVANAIYDKMIADPFESYLDFEAIQKDCIKPILKICGQPDDLNHYNSVNWGLSKQLRECIKNLFRPLSKIEEEESNKMEEQLNIKEADAESFSEKFTQMYEQHELERSELKSKLKSLIEDNFKIETFIADFRASPDYLSIKRQHNVWENFLISSKETGSQLADAVKIHRDEMHKLIREKVEKELIRWTDNLEAVATQTNSDIIAVKTHLPEVVERIKSNAIYEFDTQEMREKIDKYKAVNDLNNKLKEIQEILKNNKF